MKKILIFAQLISSFGAFTQFKFPLYDGKVPNSIITENLEKSVTTNGILRISDVSIPELWYYPAPKESSNGTCVIICPGGGYRILAASHEGADVAQKFNEMGVSAFVLKYRIPNDKAQINKEIAPLQDAQQAFRIVRKRAVEFNVNPNKLGIMGFSAGGHLAATAGTHFEKQVGEMADNSTNIRPDFMILGYPVISFKDFGHKGSAESLLGKNASTDKIELYSNELHVKANTPPTFLVHAADDKAVPVKNSLVFYEALIQNNVPVEMHLYPKGGHGFGMKNATHPDMWMERVRNWMESMSWLKK